MRRCVLWLAGVSAVALACEPHAPLGADPTIREREACLLAEDGGQIFVSGASLDVPADALFDDACLRLSHASTIPAPEAFELLSPIVVVEPEASTELRRPYTLTIDYEGESSSAAVARYVGGGEWVRAGELVLETIIVGGDSASVRTFFDGVLAVVDAPDAECLTDADCLEEGTLCDARFTCGDVFCEGDEDCDEGAYCGVDNECIGGCESDADCDAGFCSDAGACELEPCVDDFDCAAEQFCFFDPTFFEGPFTDPEEFDEEDIVGLCVSEELFESMFELPDDEGEFPDDMPEDEAPDF